MMRAKLIVAAVALIVSFAACASQRSLETQSSLPKHVIIFVPGYKGSRLVHAETGQKVWLSLHEVLFGNQSLTLPRPGLEFPAALPLTADSVLTSIDIIPWLFDYTVYGNWLNKLNAHYAGKARVISFPYDWRKSHTEILPELAKLTTQLRAEGVRRISIIGHSMGGMLVAAYLRFGADSGSAAADTWEGSQMVDTAVVVGAPFRGTIIMFHDMLHGTPTAGNDVLLNQAALASFGSCYELLPDPMSGTLLNEDLSNSAALLSDVAAWKKFGWGIFHDTATIDPTVLQARENYFQHSLTSGQTFLRRLNAPLENEPAIKRTNLLSIVSGSERTLERALMKQSGEVVFDSQETDLYSRGDGLLSLRSTALPEAFKRKMESRVLELPGVHAELLDEPDIQRAIFEFIDEVTPPV